MMFEVGQFVKTAKTVKPTRFARKRGIVISLNEDEIGVQLNGESGSTIWFRSSELS